jgi:nitrogen regulatory protein PII
MTVWETRDSNPETARTAHYRGHEFKIDLPRAVVEIVTDDCWVDDIIRKLPLADGRIEVFSVEASYHVRNGFMDF